MLKLMRRTVLIFDVDGPLITADTGDQLSPKVRDRLIRALLRGDIVVLNTGRLAEDMVSKIMLPVIEELRKQGKADNEVLRRFYGYAEKGAVFVNSDMAQEWPGSPETVGRVNTKFSVPPHIADQVKKLIAEPPYLGVMKFYEGKRTMVTVDRDRSCPNWHEKWKTVGPELEKAISDLVQNAVRSGQLEAGRVKVTRTSDAVDVESMGVGKALGARLALERAAIIDKDKVDVAVGIGDSVDDQTMGAAISEWIRSSHNRRGYLFDVRGNELECRWRDVSYRATVAETTDGTLELLDQLTLFRQAGLPPREDPGWAQRSVADVSLA
jgi:hydroxymethylpyrimidine pyrophosphatase-like HAD family hydrolase